MKAEFIFLFLIWFNCAVFVKTCVNNRKLLHEIQIRAFAISEYFSQMCAYLILRNAALFVTIINDVRSSAFCSKCNMGDVIVY